MVLVVLDGFLDTHLEHMLVEWEWMVFVSTGLSVCDSSIRDCFQRDWHYCRIFILILPKVGHFIVLVRISLGVKTPCFFLLPLPLSVRFLKEASPCQEPLLQLLPVKTGSVGLLSS